MPPLIGVVGARAVETISMRSRLTLIYRDRPGRRRFGADRRPDAQRAGQRQPGSDKHDDPEAAEKRQIQRPR